MEGFVLLTNDEIDNIKALLSIIEDESDVAGNDKPTTLVGLHCRVMDREGTLKNIHGLATDLLTML